MVLDPDDRCVSQERVRAHTTPRRDARRARIVLPAVGGCPAWRIAEIMQVDVSTVVRWRDRFAREGAGRAGRPAPRLTARQPSAELPRRSTSRRTTPVT
ncbi:helix-turn-helix domain-containing protein [Streptomyces sp. NPDC058686]|uniref:helix-turn-helix domain-containing protein n=1 Tax=Streptomyces sp. NPDC058686 TaxID=3346599 RepID=UPI00365B2946